MVYNQAGSGYLVKDCRTKICLMKYRTIFKTVPYRVIEQRRILLTKNKASDLGGFVLWIYTVSSLRIRLESRRTRRVFKIT